jgi:4-amino-4-deoxy-L-arabinose transferase-like glycosyltransferase
LAGYLFAWTLYGVIAKSSQDLHPDMTELVAWSRDLAFGFPKHPPFAAIIVRAWFAWFPIDDWTYYLLAVLTATSALWIAWQLYADYLPPTKRIVGLCLLTFIPFFNFHALKFNVNTVLMPLWALTTFWFLRSYRTRSAAYAALAGASAALCIMTKYWSFSLLAALAVAAILDGRRSEYFRSPSPWITILVGMAVISPHIGWLEKHNFSPIEYAMSVHGGHSVAEATVDALRYCLDAIAYVSVPIAILLLAARPRASTFWEIVWPANPDRRFIAVAFGTTLLMPIVPALLWGIDIDAIWSMPAWTLLPVLLLSLHSVRLSHLSVRWIVGITVLLPWIMLPIAPVVALVDFKRNLPPQLTQTRMLAERVEGAWHMLTSEPLRYVGGNADLAYGVVAYAQWRPQALPGLPTVPRARLESSGLALICEATDDRCTMQSNQIAGLNPASQKIQIELVRHFLGIAGWPQRYLLFLIPPASVSSGPTG